MNVHTYILPMHARITYHLMIMMVQCDVNECAYVYTTNARAYYVSSYDHDGAMRCK